MQKGFLILSERSGSKGFAGIIVLIVILIIAGLAGAYFFGKSQVPKPQNQVVVSQSPQPVSSSSAVSDETANWKTYTNSVYNFSFQYPTNFSLKEDDSGVSISVYLKNTNFSLVVMRKNYDSSGSVGISYAELKNAFEKAPINKTYQNSETHRKFTNLGEKSIGGISFMKLKIQNISDVQPQPEGETFSTELIGVKGDNLYRFLNANDSLTTQILSTLKFLDQNQAAETVNWKTYTNNKYRYSIKHPPEWTIDESVAENVHLYPKRLTPEILKKLQDWGPFSEPEVFVDILPQSYKKPVLSEFDLEMSEIEPQTIKVSNIEGFYYRKACVPRCPITADLPFIGNQTLQFGLVTTGPENIDEINKEFHFLIQDPTEDIFKQIITSLKLIK